MDFEKGENGEIKCPFDHHSPDFASNHFSILDEMRSAGPLVWSDQYGGFWIATSYDLVRKLYVNSNVVSVDPGPDFKGGILIPPDGAAASRPRFIPGEAEGADHNRYRLALNPHFSRARIAQMQPVIERHVSQAIERILTKGEFDVIGDYIFPILSGIACEHLGLVTDDPSAFFHSCSQMVSFYGDQTSDEFGRLQGTFSWAWDTLVETVKDRRINPRNDVISALVAFNDGEFTDDEVRRMALNVVLGAGETTSAMMGQATTYLADHPELRNELRENPELIRAAVEEFLRLFMVTTGPCRTITKEIEVEGVTLRVGDRLMLSNTAANHDPAQYPDPYAFDVHRDSHRHLAMGVGTHFCLGAHLAKAISAESLKQLLEHAPEWKIDKANSHSNADKSGLNAWESVPAVVR